MSVLAEDEWEITHTDTHTALNDQLETAQHSVSSGYTVVSTRQISE